MDLALDAVGLLPLIPSVGMIKAAGKALSKTEGAYEIAKAGGTHSGLLRNYAQRSTKEIQDAIKSYEKRVAEHVEKLANPEKYAKNWENMSVEAREGLLQKWQTDLQRNKNEGYVMRGILRDRGVQ